MSGVGAGSTSMTAQALIWSEWARADDLAAEGRIEEAAELSVRAALDEEEFLWGPVADRGAWLDKRVKAYLAKREERP